VKCRLNATYFEALAACPLVLVKAEAPWGGWSIAAPYADFSLSERKLSCCGINELVFTNMMATSDAAEITSDVEYRNVLAGLIWVAAGNTLPYAVGTEAKDGRVMVASMISWNDPEKAAKFDPYYARIQTVLLGFGFRQVNNIPYVNANSNNKITVLLGRMPTPQKYLQSKEVITP
jgi:hypothetical protein